MIRANYDRLLRMIVHIIPTLIGVYCHRIVVAKQFNINCVD